jgi:hypothetical protein
MGPALHGCSLQQSLEFDSQQQKLGNLFSIVPGKSALKKFGFCSSVGVTHNFVL